MGLLKGMHTVVGGSFLGVKVVTGTLKRVRNTKRKLISLPETDNENTAQDYKTLH